jgi:vancomycin permeability regulator SanA
MRKKTVVLSALIPIILCLIILPAPLVWLLDRDKIKTLAEAEQKPVAIVFGAAIRGENPSHVYQDRLQTAANLYHAGKVNHILVSGDNSRQNYNEPQVGKKFLTEVANVNAEDITLDYAGFRTYDTCARAKRIFGVDEAILTTQKYHLYRALFLCNALGVESVGVPADLRQYRGMPRFLLREQLARYIAFWEGTIFQHDPTVLGEQEPIVVDSP